MKKRPCEYQQQISLITAFMVVQKHLVDEGPKL